MPDSLRNTREAGAVLARGGVLDCGVGTGYAMRVALGSDAVHRYLGLELDAETAARARGLTPWQRRGRAVIAEVDAIDFLRGSTDKYDTILWDISPLLSPDGKRMIGSGYLHDTPGLPALLAARLAPGGQVLTWQFGDSAPWDIGALRRTLNVTLESLDGHTCCLARYQAQ